MIPGNLDMTDGEPEPINSNPTPKWWLKRTKEHRHFKMKKRGK
jgi:hypothetical protein